MIKALVFDCGGVFVKPTTGDWLLAPGFEEILGHDFLEKHMPDFRRVRGGYQHLLPDTNRMDTDDEECAMFAQYFDAIFREIGIALTREQLSRLSHIQTFVDGRYVFFDDVMPFLRKWRKTYKLGIVSDAPPSTRRILSAKGVLSLIDGATFSCDLGVLKPDPRIFEATLAKLGVLPEEAVFVDDFPSKLRGGVNIGMHGVQMRRPMPELFHMPPEWGGPLVHDFTELDAYLQSL